MPEVPYKPFPTVRPTERGIPGIQVSFPRPDFTKAIGEALGDLGHATGVLGNATTGVGAALATFGKSIEGAGDEIFNRAAAIKHIENQTAATEADTKFMMEAGQMHAAFSAQTGGAASGGLEAHMKALQEARLKIRNTLTNDDARHAYDQESLRTLGRTIFSAANHAAAQGKGAYIGAVTANSQMLLNEIANNPDAPDIEDKKRKLEDNDRILNDAEGSKGEAAKMRLFATRSKINAAQLTGLGRTDPATALDKLEELKKAEGDQQQILAVDAERVKSTLETKYEESAIRNTVQKHMNSFERPKTQEERDKEPSLVDTVNKVVSDLEKDPRLKDIPDWKKKAVGDTEAAWAKVKRSRDDEIRRQDEVLDNAANGGYQKDKPLPTTRAEAFAQDPNVEPAFDASSGHKKRSFDAALRQNAQGDFPKTEASWREKVKIIGQLNSKDAEERNAALWLNTSELKMPREWRAEIKKEQENQRKKGEADPRIGHAWGQLGNIIPEDVRTGRNSSVAAEYRGGLLDALAEFQRVEGRQPKGEEIKAIGRALNETLPGTGWFGSDIGNRRVFEVDPKEDEKIQKLDPSLTPEQRQEVYIRRKLQADWQRLFGRPKPAKPE